MKRQIVIALIVGLLLGFGGAKLLEIIEKTSKTPQPEPTQAEKANQLLRERCPQILEKCSWLKDSVFPSKRAFQYKLENQARFSTSAGLSLIIEGLDTLEFYFPDFSLYYLHHFDDGESLEKIKYVQSCINNIRGWTDILNDQMIYLKSDLDWRAVDFTLIGYEGDFCDENNAYHVTFNTDFTKILNIEKIKIIDWNGITMPYDQYLINQRDIKRLRQ